jgi:transposase-like protein
MPTDDLDRFCCHNPDCDAYGRRGGDNILVIDHFGRARHRLLYCRTCKARFSEFKGTPFFNSKPPHDKVTAILQHLADGCGIRQTARLVGVNKDTVTRLALLAGAHAKATHDELVAFSPLDARGPVR